MDDRKLCAENNAGDCVRIMEIPQSEQFKFEKLKELEKERFELEYGRILKQGFFGFGGFFLALIQVLFGIRDLKDDERYIIGGLIIITLVIMMSLYFKYENEKIRHLSLEKFVQQIFPAGRVKFYAIFDH